MKKKRIPLGFFAFGAFLLFAVVMVTRSVLAGPQTVVTEKDVKKAERVAKPKAGRRANDRAHGRSRRGQRDHRARRFRETKLASHVPGGASARCAWWRGKTSRPGAAIAELQNEAEKSALEAAEADLGVRRAELLRVARGLRAEDRQAIVADTSAARRGADLSQGTLARLEAAAKGGAATVDEVARARGVAEADRSALDAAEARKRAACCTRALRGRPRGAGQCRRGHRAP